MTSAGIGWSLPRINTVCDSRHGWLLTDRPSPGISMNNLTSSLVATSVFAFSSWHHCLLQAGSSPRGRYGNLAEIH